MDGSSRDVVEGWHLCLQVVEDVSLYASFLLAEPCPPENRKAERYRCGVKRIYLATQLEYVRCPLLSSQLHHVKSELLEDAIVTISVSC